MNYGSYRVKIRSFVVLALPLFLFFFPHKFFHKENLLVKHNKKINKCKIKTIINIAGIP